MNQTIKHKPNCSKIQELNPVKHGVVFHMVCPECDETIDKLESDKIDGGYNSDILEAFRIIVAIFIVFCMGVVILFLSFADIVRENLRMKNKSSRNTNV